MRKSVTDKGFNYFLEKFSLPDWQIAVDQNTINHYRGKLPDKLLFYWEKMGFCRFKQGLFWIVNPTDYADELAIWLGEDILKQDNYYVIARSAFGKLYVWGEKTGHSYTITPTLGWIYQEVGEAKDIAEGLANEKMELFFAFKKTKNVDMVDNNSKPLFDRCVKKFGALEHDEMFGFVPALAISDNASIKNIDKMNIFVHLNILADLIEIQHIDFKKLGQMAFGIEDTSNLPDLNSLQ